MMRSCPHSVTDLLPHAPPMVLLDEIIGWNQGQISVALVIRPGIPFFVDAKGVPAYVGLEYMAQACGVYAGIEGRNLGQPIRLGFLLGTRNYHSATDWFRPGQRLVIDANEVFRQELMGVFDCRISREGTKIASAQLNVYQPEETDGAFSPKEAGA